MPTALVRRPSSRLGDGLVTHVERVAVDAGLAAEQHAAYVQALRDAGWDVAEVAPADNLPDSAFVEDTVVVCGDLAILARPGAPERAAEVEATEHVLRDRGLEIVRIEEPGTLDGGDVLQVDDRIYVGRGGRTNEAGIEQLRAHAGTRGRTVVAVPLRDVLHLKSAVTALPDGTVVCADPSVLDTSPLPPLQDVPEEGGSHVVLLGGDRILMASSAPRSAELFASMGFDVTTVDISEFEKMEGCVTCLSVLIDDDGASA